jgi:hypothetical protein
VNAQSTLLPTQSTQQEKKNGFLERTDARGEDGAPPGSTLLGSRSAAQGHTGGRRQEVWDIAAGSISGKWSGKSQVGGPHELRQ